MADKKITELTNITGANLADADEFVVVDSSASETKAITRSELGLGINKLGYNGTQKIITTSTGVDVTGTVTADGLTVDGNITSTGGDLNLATLDLNAIAASKAVTAVDVFVYDTSKDSDGGAWRKRTQHTSWYNETLNTATRGSRREFPAVAVIVAEAGKVTIYDGDDPALPMWMVFNQNIATTALIRVAEITSTFATNGIVSLGGGSTTGLVTLHFVDDFARKVRNASQSGSNTTQLYGPLVDRNIAAYLVGGNASLDLVNSTVNDVAMTVLPDAPIDPATGLPVPTIAVATAGGVSVIKDDGNVWDITSSAVSAVGFSGPDALFSRRGAIFQIGAIPTADISEASWRRAYYWGSSGDVIIGAGGSKSLSLGGSEYAVDTSASMNLLSEDPTGTGAGPNGSMVAYISSTYNTGWMNGDIKGAFLSSTDATSLVGSELITGQNRTFSVDAADRTAFLAAYSDYSIPDTNYLVSVSGGVLSISRNSGGTSGPTINCTTVSGKRYAIVAKIEAMSHDITLLANPQASVGDSAAVVGSYYYATFTAASTSTDITVFPAASVSATLSISDLRLVAIDDDRSVNNKGLIVNGTVTRSAVATGAELVAYSGFSSSNYLEQPYNSALDFGTGDFCVMGWVNLASTGYGALVHRSAAKTSTGDAGFCVFYFPTGVGFKIGSQTCQTTTYRPMGLTHICAKRDGTVGTLYINGQLVATNSGMTNSATVAGATLAIGGYWQTGVPFVASSNDKFSLVRISATAPTADQIKKIYEDEKVLFQENAACTLYGTSDAVTALAHDPDTGLLHVGTSAGRSVFQGLRRVSNTTTAVGTAISASNGLVVEE